MRNKVSNRVYQALIEMHPEREWDPAWKKGGSRDDVDYGIAGEHFDWPVYRVSVDDGHHFARFLGGKRAELPTPREWDQAGGRFKGKEGPFLGEGPRHDTKRPPFALREEGPLPVGSASRDESCFGCQDMASNGLEWTSCVARPENELIPFEDPIANPMVSLRGASYRDTGCFRFLHDIGQVPTELRFPEVGKLNYRDEIGFRVVLHVPLAQGPAPGAQPR